MKFFEKMKKLIPLRHVVFVFVLFLAVLVIHYFDSAEDVKISFDDEAVTINSSNYKMNISYELIASAELVTMPDGGEPISGSDNIVLRTGNWKNETWGEYYVCADLDCLKCIVAHLTDGRIFVFSRKNDTETAAIFETLQGYLS